MNICCDFTVCFTATFLFSLCSTSPPPPLCFPARQTISSFNGFIDSLYKISELAHNTKGNRIPNPMSDTICSREYTSRWGTCWHYTRWRQTDRGQSLINSIVAIKCYFLCKQVLFVFLRQVLCFIVYVCIYTTPQLFVSVRCSTWFTHSIVVLFKLVIRVLCGYCVHTTQVCRMQSKL